MENTKKLVVIALKFNVLNLLLNICGAISFFKTSVIATEVVSDDKFQTNPKHHNTCEQLYNNR